MFPYIADTSRRPAQPDARHHETWPVHHPRLLFAGLALDRPAYVDLWQTLGADPTVDEVIRNFVVGTRRFGFPMNRYIGKVTSLYRSSEPILLDTPSL
jgi:hypothetical protein